MDLIEYPGRCARRNSGIQAEFVCWLREAICEIVNEAKAASKFEWRDASNAGVVVVVEFNAEEMLKHILIGAGVKRWTETIGGYHCRAGEHGFVRVTTMEEIFEQHTRRRCKVGWRQCGC